jgi:putative ABC transport system permease protein
VWQDVRYSLRMLRRSPAFASVAILVLALGVGVNTAVFSIVNAAFFRPLPLPAPQELVYLYQVNQYHEVLPTHVADVDFFETQHRDAFAGVTGHANIASARFTAGDETDLISGEAVESNYFDVLRVKAALGRTFGPDDGLLKMSEWAVVISYDWWTRRFQRDPAVVGRQVQLEGVIFTIIGVTAPGFVGVSDPWNPSQYWVPYRSPVPFGVRTDYVIGRLQPGVSVTHVRAIAAAQTPERQQRWAAQMNRMDAHQFLPYLVLPASDVRTPFDPRATLVPARLASAVAVVVAIVLLIASSNIAGILMARGVARSSELAVRQALGAAASRLVRQLLTESVLLAAAGGLFGLLVAWLLVAIYRLYTPSQYVVDVPLDLRVLLFTAAVCMGAGLLVGLAPALQALKVDILAALGAGVGATTRVRRRLRHGIVMPQIALAVVLLMVAGVHVHALMQIEQTDLGYDLENRVVLNVNYEEPQSRVVRLGSTGAKDAKDARDADAERTRTFYAQVFERLQALPGITGVALTSNLPVSAAQVSVPYISQDAFRSGGTDIASVSGSEVSQGYFRTMGMSVLEGRDFDSRETLTSPPVVIISAGLAKRLWPHEDPLGKSAAVYPPNPQAPAHQKPRWHTVVGVVNDVDPILHSRQENPEIYLPLNQIKGLFFTVRVVAWGRGDPATVLARLTHVITSVGPFAQVSDAQTMTQLVGEILYPRRTAAGILVACGLVGLLLASVGLYGLISYSVALRLREIGIRSTLGADRGDVIALVLREGGTVAALGAGPGVALSLVALRLTSSLVGAVPTTDVAAFLGVLVLITTVILLACYLPARRAARIDPMLVLRGL